MTRGKKPVNVDINFWPLSKTRQGDKCKWGTRCAVSSSCSHSNLNLSSSRRAVCLWSAGGTVWCKLLLWPWLQRSRVQPLYYMFSSYCHVSAWTATWSTKSWVICCMCLSGLLPTPAPFACRPCSFHPFTVLPSCTRPVSVWPQPGRTANIVSGG